MPLLIDGNNLLHRLPVDRRHRAAVRSLTLELVRHEKLQVTVVFDGPPPSGAPPTEHLGRTTIVYAGNRTADDVIIDRLPGPPASRSWVVVTDDRGLAERARHRGAAVRSLAAWQSKLAKPRVSRRREAPLSRREVEEWEAYFASRSTDTED